MPSRKLPRRRFQRAFYQWLRRRQATLPMRLVVDRRTDRVITCRVAHACPNIVISITHEVNIIAELNGEGWDLLSSFDCIPRRGVEGYACPWCSESDKESYPCRACFWQARLFEPLAHWLDRLLAAHWLLFYQTGQGSSWAKLSIDPDITNVPQTCLMAAVPVHHKER